MDLRKVKKLIELLEESDMSEIEVHEGEESVRISRHSSAPLPTQQHYVVAPTVPAAASAPGPDATPPAGPGDTGATPPPAAEGEKIVKAPIIGTFYRSPAPGKPPFAEEGDTVQAGQTLCIIEAMKMMNRIEAPASGVLKKFTVEDADPVEYDQAIAVIQT